MIRSVGQVKVRGGIRSVGQVKEGPGRSPQGGHQGCLLRLRLELWLQLDSATGPGRVGR